MKKKNIGILLVFFFILLLLFLYFKIANKEQVSNNLKSTPESFIYNSNIIKDVSYSSKDADGILIVRADLGILKPISQTQTWVTLFDNGQGLDRVAGDGIYTAAASVRSSTPLSSHEIKVQASDSYGEATPPIFFDVVVSEADNDDLLGDGDGLSITFIAIIVAIGALGAAAFVMLRQRNPPEKGSDRFGFQ